MLQNFCVLMTTDWQAWSLLRLARWLTWVSFLILVATFPLLTQCSLLSHFASNALDWLGLWNNDFIGEFTCPDSIELCFISCFDDDNTSGKCRYFWQLFFFYCKWWNRLRMSVLDPVIAVKHKLDEFLCLVERKVRLCVNSSQQIEGLDYDELYAPTTLAASIRILVVVSCEYTYIGVQLYHIDIKNAFQGTLVVNALWSCDL